MAKRSKSKAESCLPLTTLRSLCPDYQPTLRNLRNFMISPSKAEDYDHHLNILASEKLLISLFCTRSGYSILQLLYDLSCGRIKLTDYKKDLKIRQINSEWKLCFKDWCSDISLMSTFCDFLLDNETVALSYEKYSIDEFKLSLKFLLPESLQLSLIDLKYNLLLDYLLHSKLLIEDLLIRSVPSLLEDVISQYHTVFQFNGYVSWYNIHQKPPKIKNICQKFLNNLFDKFSVNKDLIPNLNRNFMSHLDYSSFVHKVTFTSNSLDSDLNHDNWPRFKSSNKEQVYSFEINQDGSLDFPDIFNHAKKRHVILYGVLGLSKCESPLLKSQFLTFCHLLDPITQPPPTESHIISIDLIYQMSLGLMFDEINELKNIVPNWKFHYCFNLQTILLKSMERLNCHDFNLLNSINNNDDTTDWHDNLHKWTPQGLNIQDLELVYMVDILSVYSMYQLYTPIPVQLNPFLVIWFQLWKNLTNVVLLGLEIDRLEDESETYDTPILVRATIRGSSALRCVIAVFINNQYSIKEHDFKHEPINLFMSPHGRKLCQGALFTDARSHAAALLALGISLEHVTELLSDLQPGDRFDEDVKYMFDYEYDDYNAIDTDLLDENDHNEETLEELEQREHIKEIKGYYKRCHCVFDDDEFLSDNEDEEEDDSVYTATHIKSNVQSCPTIINSSRKPLALRSHTNVEFDFNGKDWRDIPRGSNFYYLEHYVFVQKLHADVVYYLLKEATMKTLEVNHASFILRSIATCVKLEQEQNMVKNLIIDDKSRTIPTRNELTSDFIYEKLSENSLFEKIMYYNNELVWKIVDEMLMCSGYRRVLIWFITHLDINYSMIHYIFELVMGLRGNVIYDQNELKIENSSLDILDGFAVGSSIQSIKVPFSRQGYIVLSNIELKMLLQEFFTNAAIFFSKVLKESFDKEIDPEVKSDHSNKSINVDTYQSVSDTGIPLRIIGLMKLVCFMVNALIEKNKIDFTDSEYVFELQALLMNWVDIIDEAHALFFKLKSQIVQPLDQDFDKYPDNILKDQLPIDLKLSVSGDLSNTTDSEGLISEYNLKLIKLLPQVSNKENSAVTALRSFIQKYPLNTRTPDYGRKVIYNDDKIMGLYITDKEMVRQEFLAEFGIDYNELVKNMKKEEETENIDTNFHTYSDELCT